MSMVHSDIIIRTYAVRLTYGSAGYGFAGTLWDWKAVDWKAVEYRCAAARREFTLISLFAPMPFA